VCDGDIDCWNGGIDEQHCIQLEMNECQDNEYRCRNGQCIPNDFLQDNYFTPDCLDTTDEDIESWILIRKAKIIKHFTDYIQTSAEGEAFLEKKFVADEETSPGVGMVFASYYCHSIDPYWH
jgi:hypothetical protein